MPLGVPGASQLKQNDNEVLISERSMEDLYCQEQLQVESFSPDQGYKTDYSGNMANWPTVTKVCRAGL